MTVTTLCRRSDTLFFATTSAFVHEVSTFAAQNELSLPLYMKKHGTVSPSIFLEWETVPFDDFVRKVSGVCTGDWIPE